MTTPNVLAPAKAAAPPVLIGPADSGFINGEQLKARMDLIYDVMKHVMEEGVDFGVIPGCEKPSLWKPGAEKLCVAFRIAAGEPEVEDLSSPDEIRYRVKVPGINQVTGALLGVGVGECSTSEKKYKWRYPVHPNEWKAAPADRRREVFKRDGSTYQQVRTDPADLANTVLKMAHKRALVAMALVVTGASSVFGQDLEDLPEEVREAVMTEETGASPRRKPQRASQTQKGTGAKSSAPRQVSDPVTIVDVTEKATAKGTVYWIKASDGHLYSTFDEEPANELRSFKGTSDKVRITYTVKQVGDKQYRNYVDVTRAEEPPAANGQAAPPDGPDPELSEEDLFGTQG